MKRSELIARVRERRRLRAMRMARSFVLETAGFLLLDSLTETYGNLTTGEQVVGVGAWIYSSILWTQVEELERLWKL